MKKIAIVGLSCLYPDAKNYEQFWNNIIQGKNSTSSITTNELEVSPKLFYDKKKGKFDKFYSLRGAFIKNFEFNYSEYDLPQEFLASLDNNFKWSLYVAKQALQDSGYYGKKSILSKCGVILGTLSLPSKFSSKLLAPIYKQVTESAIKKLLEQEEFDLTSLISKANVSCYNGMISSFPASLIAQAFCLSDINFCFNSACSSSFYAIKLASHYLWSHKADLMLAGGISCSDPLTLRMGFSTIQAHPDSNDISRPFDKSSTGVITGEGAGMVVLKRYDDAIRDGDRILATICGNGLSNDGKGKHLLSPNSKGQVLAFERAYQEAQMSPKSIDYLECHATGTPLGDMTELNSIKTFFSQHQSNPLLGTVKANVGHLLTASGMVGLTKVILSMSHGVIPPSINIDEPISCEDNPNLSQRIVKTPTAWPKKSSIKQAAITAFGFGGSNAHIIIEQGTKPESTELISQTQAPIKLDKIAITGMDVFFSGCDGIEAFQRTIYDGIQQFTPLPPSRWYGVEEENKLLENYGFVISKEPIGGYIKEFEIDTSNVKIPPNEIEKLNPQQLLMLKVANRAIKDARLELGGNIAVVIAADTELSSHRISQRWHLSWQLRERLEQNQISFNPEKIAQLEEILQESIDYGQTANVFVSRVGSVVASRISAVWDFTGPALTISSGENSTFKALEVAQMLLTTNEVEAVVVGAVDLAGGVENVLLRNQLAKINTGVNTLSYDEFCNGWTIGEGAGAVVLKSHQDAKQNGDKIYANIDAIGFAQQHFDVREFNQGLPNNSPETVVHASQKAFDIAGIKPADVDYLEVFGSGIPQQDEAEIAGLLQAYRNSKAGLNCALGSIKANIGHTYIASGIASLIKTVLCLYRKYIPATPQWNKFKQSEKWEGSPFYVATESTPWFIEKYDSPRVAAINGMGIDGTCVHVILSSEMEQQECHDKYLGHDTSSLFLQNSDNINRKSLKKIITLGRHRIVDKVLTEENIKIFRQSSKGTKPEFVNKIDKKTIAENNQLAKSKKTVESNKFMQLTNNLESNQSLHQQISSDLSLKEAHAAFLQARQEASKQISEIIELEMTYIQKILDLSS